MTSELRQRHQASQTYVRALTAAFRSGVEIHDPSVWLGKEHELEDKLMRDADIAHAVLHRAHMVAGRRWNIEPRNDGSPLASLAVHVGTELLGAIEQFTSARLNLSRAFLSGQRFGYVHGRPVVLPLGDGRLRTWWVPTRIEDMDKRFLRIATSNADGKIAARWQRWNIEASEFQDLTPAQSTRLIRHTYQDDQSSMGHGRGLREALAWWWYAKQHVFEESLQASERFGQGILSAKIDGARDADGMPNLEVIEATARKLQDLMARNVIVTDKQDVVEFIQTAGEGWQLMKDLRDEFRSTIYTLVLGANLTTSANEGGSYALAAVQENSTEALVQFDRETLEETLTRNLIGSVWAINHRNLVELGIANEKPRFAIAQEKREDPLQRAQVAQTLAGMGVPISVADVREQTGFKKPEEGEELVKAPTPSVPSVPGFGGLGGDLFGQGGRGATTP
jgi:phage gp29-like protein